MLVKIPADIEVSAIPALLIFLPMNVSVMAISVVLPAEDHPANRALLVAEPRSFTQRPRNSADSLYLSSRQATEPCQHNSVS